MLITTDTSIAGKAYQGSYTQCQYCPDPLMTMIFTNGVYSCRCPTGYTITGLTSMGTQSCILTSLTTPFSPFLSTSSQIVYLVAGKTLNSLTIQHYYLQAVSLCTYSGSDLENHYCQLLANLCVLQLYLETSVVCKNYLDIINFRGVRNNTYNVENWVVGMPWIYYTQNFDGDQICLQSLVKQRVSLNDFAMNYVVASYALNGTFMGYGTLEDLFRFCKTSAPYDNRGFFSSKWQLFGHYKLMDYQCDVASLLTQETLFYEIFYYDANDDTYVPVPVRIPNFDGWINFWEIDELQMCKFSDFMVRRFMLFDVVSGITNANNYPEVIRYAYYISMAVTLEEGKQSTIYPPTLTVEYWEVGLDEFSQKSESSSLQPNVHSSLPVTMQIDNRASIWENPWGSLQRVFRESFGSVPVSAPAAASTSSSEESSSDQSVPMAVSPHRQSRVGVKPRSKSSPEVASGTEHGRRLATAIVPKSEPLTITYDASFTFESVYLIDYAYYYSTQMTMFIVALILGAIMFLVRYNNWRRRNSRLITTATLSTNLGALNFKNVMNLSIMLLHSYVLIMFLFIVLVSWYFFVFLKLQSVPSIMLPPWTTWVEPMDEAHPYSFWYIQVFVIAFFHGTYVFVKLVYNQSHADLFFIDWEPLRHELQPTGENANARGGVSSNHLNGSVSVWRTILVANEFAELQTQRRSSIYFTLFWLGFFLLGLDLQYNATNQPDLTDVDADRVNIILRFANSTFFWIILSLAQYIWKYFIYERYISEPPEQVFLDFCTIAKVSILILDEQYHGYYLHCRSPFQYADGNMLELIGKSLIPLS